jgi:quercetin dioxygenase-like cupin family protein
MGSDRHRKLTQDARDRVTIYVLGGMRGAEITRFEKHLAGCRTCREEASCLEPVITELVLGGPEADPPPGLRERVLTRVRRRPPALLRAADRHWLASDVPGVEIAQLWLDTERRRHTTLLRMASGTSLPAHRHGGPEECYVLAGDLRDRDLVLGAGDYVRHDEGTQHLLTTRGGCLLLITASLDDKRIATT